MHIAARARRVHTKCCLSIVSSTCTVTFDNYPMPTSKYSGCGLSFISSLPLSSRCVEHSLCAVWHAKHSSAAQLGGHEHYMATAGLLFHQACHYSLHVAEPQGRAIDRTPCVPHRSKIVIAHLMIKSWMSLRSPQASTVMYS